MYIEYKILYIIINISYIYTYMHCMSLDIPCTTKIPRLGSQLGCATPEGISLIESGCPGCLSADKKTWRKRESGGDFHNETQAFASFAKCVWISNAIDVESLFMISKAITELRN